MHMCRTLKVYKVEERAFIYISFYCIISEIEPLEIKINFNLHFKKSFWIYVLPIY